MPTNRRIVMASRPEGAPGPEHFRLETVPAPEPAGGEVLLRTLFLSLDPYMRGRMSAARSYAKPVEPGETMVGQSVCEVVESRHPTYEAGDVVLANTGWQEFGVSDGTDLRKLDAARAPLTTALGVLGMPGLTAWAGLANIGQPKPGETLVVAAATGPVGSLVGQLARERGCRVVGVAGGPEKVAYLRDALGFDAAVDHRAPDMKSALEAACPDGVDIYFENVGGAVWDAVFPLLNPFARVPVCGLIANYNLAAPPSGPDRTAAMMRDVLTKRLRIQGFIVTDYASQGGEFMREVGALLAAGKVRFKEDVVNGLENAPEAFIGLLNGRNFGKLVIKVSERSA